MSSPAIKSKLSNSVLALACCVFVLGLTGNIYALAANEVSYNFEETSPEGYWNNCKFSSITTATSEVIGGRKSLKLDTTSSGNEWNELFVTLDTATPLKGGKRYSVSFRYCVKQFIGNDSYIYALARSKSKAKADKGFLKWKENYKKPDLREIKFALPEGVDDYRIIFGIRFRGSVVIDDIKIRNLPDIDLTAEGIEISDSNYSPYAMCTHLERRAHWKDKSFSEQQVKDALKMLASAGIQWIRIGGGWDAMQANEDKRDSANIQRLDLIINEAQANDIGVYIQMGSQPRWASEDPEKSDTHAYAPAEDHWDDWADHVTFLTKRYKGRVTHWGVGNEVDWTFWKSDLSKYARYLKIAYKAAKAVDPNNRIVMGNFAFDGINVWQFRDGAKEFALQKLYDAGVKGHFDILGMHPYAEGTLGSVDKINTVCNILHKNGDGDKPIWITEIGKSSGSNAPAALKRQGDYLQAVYSELIKHPKVDKIFWYNFRCKANEGDRENNFGIINNDFTKRPAYKRLSDLPKSLVRKVNYSYLPQKPCGK